MPPFGKINEHSSAEELKDYELQLLASLNEAAELMYTFGNFLDEKKPALIRMQDETEETIPKADMFQINEHSSAEELKDYELQLLASLNEAAELMYTFGNFLDEKKPALIRMQDKTEETIQKADKFLGHIIATDEAIQKMHEDVKIIHSRVIAVEDCRNSNKLNALKELGDDILEVGKTSLI